MTTKLYYIGERINPQLKKSYFKQYGQLTKKEVKEKENCVYGMMILTGYKTVEEYESAYAMLTQPAQPIVTAENTKPVEPVIDHVMIRTKFSKYSETRPLWTKIKIGRKTYEVKKGDFIMDNGACLQFFAGDERTLRYSSYSSHSNIVIEKIPQSIPPFDKMRMRKVMTKGEIPVTLYYF